jgi:hypothetical protein
MANKKQLNENMWQEFFNWFTQHWNDTSHFVDAGGTSDQTRGEIFRETVYIALGLSTLAGIAIADIKGKLRSLPGKVKQIYQAGKAIRASKTEQEAEQNLQKLGLGIHAKQKVQTPAMAESKLRLAKVKYILSVLEEQVDKKKK